VKRQPAVGLLSFSARCIGSTCATRPETNLYVGFLLETGASENSALVGQVVFLLGFDRLMLTVADDHRVQVMMFSLFDLSAGRPT
jgi:hypothetical protein